MGVTNLALTSEGVWVREHQRKRKLAIQTVEEVKISNF